MNPAFAILSALSFATRFYAWFDLMFVAVLVLEQHARAAGIPTLSLHG